MAEGEPIRAVMHEENGIYRIVCDPLFVKNMATATRGVERFAQEHGRVRRREVHSFKDYDAAVRWGGSPEAYLNRLRYEGDFLVRGANLELVGTSHDLHIYMVDPAMARLRALARFRSIGEDAADELRLYERFLRDGQVEKEPTLDGPGDLTLTFEGSLPYDGTDFYEVTGLPRMSGTHIRIITPDEAAVEDTRASIRRALRLWPRWGHGGRAGAEREFPDALEAHPDLFDEAWPSEAAGVTKQDL